MDAIDPFSLYAGMTIESFIAWGTSPPASSALGGDPVVPDLDVPDLIPSQEHERPVQEVGQLGGHLRADPDLVRMAKHDPEGPTSSFLHHVPDVLQGPGRNLRPGQGCDG